jgi:hypothetical protein
MDSTMVASNIRKMGRVQLLVEVLQRVYRMLDEADQSHYAEAFAPYLQGHAGQYVYRLKREDAPSHLQQIGEWMRQLVEELRPQYAQEAVYQMLVRVLGDHFQLQEKAVSPKAEKDLSATSLQSPDDLEATYREKRGVGYQGYSANVTETCDPDNPLQLVTKVQTAANHTDDSQLLAEALPNLKERTQVETLFTDGGHGGPKADKVLQEQQVEHIQTAIRGRTPRDDRFHLADFAIQWNAEGKPVKITCPQEQTVHAHPTCQKKGVVAHFEPEACAACPLAEKCPTQTGKRDPRRALRFNQRTAQAAERRRKSQEQHQESGNLRAAVEATMRSVKHPFPSGKLPVRGQFRVTCMMLGSAAMANVRRIGRYLEVQMEQEKKAKEAESGAEGALETVSNPIFAWIKTVLGGRHSLEKRSWVFLGC